MVDALCWNMYQLADVIGKVSDALKARHPEVPWREVVGLRNFYAHTCEGIDIERLWDDLQRGDVADLATKLRVIAHEFDSRPDTSES